MTRREQNLRKWVPGIWEYLNATFFGGQLPRPRFYYVSTLGDIDYTFAGMQWTGPKGQHCMAINPRYVETRLQATSVVAHEMLHQLQLLQKSERTQREQHGRFFKRHAERLCDAGIPVTVQYHPWRGRHLDMLGIPIANAKA